MIRVKILSFIFFFIFSMPIFAKKVDVFAIIRANELEKISNIEKNPCVSGVTLYWSWRRLEPNKNEFDFSDIKKILNDFENKKIKVNLAILPGRWSPSWLEGEGVKYMHWNHLDNYVGSGKSEYSSAPIPWDEKYLFFWENFLENFVPILNNYKNINSFSITGPSNTNGLEAAVIGSDEELNRINFESEKFIDSWIRVAKKIKKFNGNYYLTVALHERFGDKRIPEIGKKIDAEMKKLLGDKYIPMLLGFEGKSWFSYGNNYADLIIKNGSADGALQVIKKYSGSEGKIGLDEAVKKANALNAKWLEIWVDDITNGLLVCN